MKKSAMVLMVLTSLLIINSCKDNGTGPEKNDPEPNYEPGRRDYVWTADTIKAYYLDFNSFWGNTIEDVWVVSLVGGTYDNIYRYNGTDWYKETREPIGNPVSLWGTESNLWISTHDGHIWNYYNNSFVSSPQYLYEGKEIDFFSIAGKNDDEVYVCGGKNIPNNKDGIIYKKNGSGWELFNILKNKGNITRIRYSMVNDRYYLLTSLFKETQNDSLYLFEYDGKELKTIYHNYISENTAVVMNDINGYMYVTIGRKIFRYYKDNYEQILEINDTKFGGQTWGRNKNDIFIRMFDGLMHYNGSDTKYILKFPINISFGTSALVLENDVFLHAFDNNTGYNIIYHGQLK